MIQSDPSVTDILPPTKRSRRDIERLDKLIFMFTQMTTKMPQNV